jgi:hypothetical protein
MSVITASILLGFAAEKFFGALFSNVSDDLYEKLKGDPAKRAYKKALGIAIQRYASGERVPITRPLLAKDGLFADSQVANELTKILLFDQEPDIELIGNRWKYLTENPPRFRSFNEDARLLVDYLESELRNTDIFRPVFKSQDLHAIANKTQITIKTLETIETQLSGLAEILDARLGLLLDDFVHSSFSIRENMNDFTFYIEEKTRGFVGRQWVFDKVNEFINRNSRGYFFLIGDPGIGKTALAAQMVKKNGYVHHFNVAVEGINKTSTFLRNVCSQLIAMHKLEYTSLPPDATEDAGFLNKILNEISEKLQEKERCIVLVDALDEVNTLGLPTGTNRLYLPFTIPEHIYFVVTMRPDESILPRVDCERGDLIIDHDSTDNLADITDYISATTSREGIKNYINSHDLDEQDFITMMVEKSEGNFMYLRFVLPEIADGVYHDLDLRELPQGLRRYYEDHWQRMKGMDLDKWLNYKLPTIVGLSIAQEPVSIQQLSFLTKLRRAHIREVLNEWQQFIHEEDNEFEGQRIAQYRFYHQSFIEFVSNKDQVKDEKVDLNEMHGKFADSMWEELFGDDTL